MILIVKRVLSALLIGLLAGSALAADPFTVARVPVDATAQTAIQAQTDAIGSGQIIAAQRLLERLTVEDERMERGIPPLTTEIVGPMIRGLSIDNERRSSTRYLGDVTIAFNPVAVQRFLRGVGLTMVTSQARERLLVPVGFSASDPLASDILSGRYAHSLTPVISPSVEDMTRLIDQPTLSQLRVLAGRYNVEQVLIIQKSDSGTLFATDLALDSGERQQLRSPIGLADLVSQIEAEWKVTSAVPIDSLQTRTVSVLYNSQSEWQRLQGALNNSAQVQDARLDALSKDGALMTISYGSLDRLAAEMSQKGVRVIEDPALGLVIRR